MARAAKTAPSDRWEVVASVVQRRMDELGLKQREVEARSGISRSVLSQILNHQNDRYAESSLRQLSKALGWEITTIERILDGVDEPASPSEISDLRQHVIELAKTIDQIADRVERLELRLDEGSRADDRPSP